MVIIPVNNYDINGFLRESFCSVDSSKAGTYYYYTREFFVSHDDVGKVYDKKI